MKRMLVAGSSGMTGTEVSFRARAGWEVHAFPRGELDITNAASVDDLTRKIRPDIVINCAAYTAVDRAESEPEVVRSVNEDGARNLARAAKAAGASLIHISTDYVFSGDAHDPYQPDSPTGPVCVYGRTKLAGEIAVREEWADHVIVRTSWVFSHRGSNFVRTMLKLGSVRDELRIVDDQVGRPTCSADLADALLRVADALVKDRSVAGTYHFANEGETTWYRLATAVFEESSAGNNGRVPKLVPIRTSDFPTAARRPQYSVLDTSSFTRKFGFTPRPWRDALRDTVELALRGSLAGA
jgi:dTDP-4-dehydrorhamnose reductase